MWRSWTTGWLAGAIALGALALAGCAGMNRSCIDPTGERIFAAAPVEATAPPATAAGGPYVESPAGPFNYDDVETQLQRTEPIVAAVGSEVVLVAGVVGTDGFLRTNRRLEWSIAPGSVGNFVAVQEGTFSDILVGDFTRPRLASNTFVVGSTGRSYLRLTRGTPCEDDDILVMRGQGWVSLTSAVEGTSNVVVVSPDVYNWQTRTKTATVHWVDAVWRFPPPAINPAGTRHVFTTTVTRQSNQCPCEGWRVRYEITSGPPAGFSPDGATVVEVPTNAAGQASAEIFQKQPVHGTNNVCIQVIRPAEAVGSGGRKLVVGTGATTKTWTAADLAITVAGPVSAIVGAPLTYRVEVTNPGDLPAREIVVTNVLPEGLTYLGSNPVAENAGRQLQWRLGELGARQRRTIEVQFRPEHPGVLTNCCEASAAGGLKVSNCATTTIGAPATAAPGGTAPPATTPGAAVPPNLPPSDAGIRLPAGTLELRVTGPAQTQVPVGSEATFEIVLLNRGTRSLTGVEIRDRLDPGLEHPQAESDLGLYRLLGDVPPGEKRVKVTLRVSRPGQLCQNIEIRSRETAPVTARACIVGVAAAAPSGPSGGWPSGVPAGPPRQTSPPTLPISVQKLGPRQPLLVGETARFTIEVVNNGTTDLRGIKVIDRTDPALMPTLASDGHRIENQALVWSIDLAAGRSSKLEVHCTCQTPASTCNRVTVLLPDGRQVEDQACVEVRAATPPAARVDSMPSTPSVNQQPANQPSEQQGPPVNLPSGPPSNATPGSAGEPLSLSVVGLRNPVATGKELTYEIRVTNAGTAAAKAVSVTGTVPEGMKVVPLGTTAPPGPRFRVDDGNRVVRFGTIDTLAAGESLTYRVRVQANQAGQYRFKVELRSPDLTKTIVEEATTEVF